MTIDTTNPFNNLKIAFVKNDEVINVVLLTSFDTSILDEIKLSHEADSYHDITHLNFVSVGSQYIDGEFTPPKPPVIETLEGFSSDTLEP